MTHAGLFSGIGGFSLAAQWMGWQNVFEVELDPFCRQVLHKNFPHSQLFTDVCTFDGLPFRGRIDVLSGGFPCQPWSDAGKKLGTADPRHLWPQFLRIIREIQPSFVVGENVRGLLSWNEGLQFEAVCADLEAEGYTVLPLLLPAASVGTNHIRNRFWFVAHANGQGWGNRLHGRESKDQRQANESANTGKRHDAAHPHNRLRYGPQNAQQAGRTLAPSGTWRLTEPPLCRPNDGLPARLVRTASPRAKQLKAYGNAIVPQVAYQIFQAIQQVEA